MKKIASILADKLQIKDFADEESFKKTVKTALTGYKVIIKYYSKEHLFGEIMVTIDSTRLEVWLLECKLTNDIVQVQYRLVLTKGKN